MFLLFFLFAVASAGADDAFCFSQDAFEIPSVHRSQPVAKQHNLPRLTSSRSKNKKAPVLPALQPAWIAVPFQWNQASLRILKVPTGK